VTTLRSGCELHDNLVRYRYRSHFRAATSAYLSFGRRESKTGSYVVVKWLDFFKALYFPKLALFFARQ